MHKCECRCKKPISTACDVLSSGHLVVHLLGAVEYVDHDAQGSAQVLGGLGFAGAGGTSRGSAHDQMQGLGQCDVTSAFERRKS